MTKKILQNLLLTFVLSLLLTGLFYSIWFSSKQRGFEEGQALTILFFVGDIFQNLILTIATLPVFFLAKHANYNNLKTRILLYFSGPVLLTLCFVLFVGNSAEDKIGFLLPGLSFVAIHSYFYFRLTHLKNDKVQ
ncbi:MAG TPA: hypothetical protein VF008_12890 [Niastella sp.]